MVIDLPEGLEAALRMQATAQGISPAGYVRQMLQRDLASASQAQCDGVPFKTGRGILAKYGQAPSAEEIDANRAEIFRNFSEEAG